MPTRISPYVRRLLEDGPVSIPPDYTPTRLAPPAARDTRTASDYAPTPEYRSALLAYLRGNNMGTHGHRPRSPITRHTLPQPEEMGYPSIQPNRLYPSPPADAGYDFSPNTAPPLLPIGPEPPATPSREAFFAANPPAGPRAGRATKDGKEAKGGGSNKPSPLIHPDLKVKNTDPPGVASLKNKLAERSLSDRLHRERMVEKNLKRGLIDEDEARGLREGTLTGAGLARKRLLRKNLERGLISQEQYDRLSS